MKPHFKSKYEAQRSRAFRPLTGLPADDMFFQKLLAEELARQRAEKPDALESSVFLGVAYLAARVDRVREISHLRREENWKDTFRIGETVMQLIELAALAQRIATELLMPQGGSGRAATAGQKSPPPRQQVPRGTKVWKSAPSAKSAVKPSNPKSI
jgi:hypothetical protein